MKKNIILTSILLLLVGQSFAHALWIATNQTGGSTQIDNSVGITLKNLDAKEGQVNLQVLFKGEALPETEVKIFVADQWSKTLTTDKEGMTSFALPWNTDYLVEGTTEERVPGTYKDEAYEFVWHCVTQYIRK
ncbi:MAG: hypothetical protein AAF694_30885 [Bacteroidota bacterium]